MTRGERDPNTEDSWALPLVLMALTLASTTYVGALMVPGAATFQRFGVTWPTDPVAGLAFSLPLMAILVAHELGHYFVGRHHAVDISKPYFIPMPIFLLGTMGAVIRMRQAIESRNALLDVGAAGPIAGLVVALPVLAYGIATSPIEPMPESGFLVEGRSLLYLALLHGLKGPIPAGHDIFLTPTAFAGWAGLLVTMINLLPVGQLDGGHVAYALFGVRQDQYSRRIARALPLLAVGVGAAYALAAWRADAATDVVLSEAMAGVHWLVWAVLLALMQRATGGQHPPAGDAPLSRGRRAVAVGMLVVFALIFMPSWMRVL